MNEKDFVIEQSKELSESIKSFPSDFIEDYEGKVISVPSKNLILGEEFFGKYEILTADGFLVLHAETYEEAKFIVYSSRLKTSSVKVPADVEVLKSSLSGYSKYLDGIIKNIAARYKKKFPEGKNLHSVTNDIFRILNLVRY
ncbi:MAG: hypothetical protein KF721_07935 [Ignavibacteriaceae bacterium]|nr:hypothetical protein [Ignavibacteriaceae bacterium]HRI47031.1 hypothetical protein [Ignavibacteriaceae bacterium]